MKTLLIIALTGKPGAGKDTIADVLAPQHGFARIAFADALRGEVAQAWRIDPRMLTDRPTKEYAIPALAVGMCGEPGFMRWCADGGESLTAPRSPRWVMQHWGTYKRRFVPDHYARIVERWIGRQVGCGWSRIVVTDLRFLIEETMLRRLGAVVVRVHRPDAAALSDDTQQHASERHGAIKAQADLVNDGTLQALAEGVVQLVQQLEAEAALTLSPLAGTITQRQRSTLASGF